MKPATGVLFGLAVGAVLMLFARSQDFGRLSDELDAREDSIAALAETVGTLTVHADSLRQVAHRADTVLLTVTIEGTQAADSARFRYEEYADSLRVTLDSAQSVVLDNVLANTRAEVAAVWRIADERLAWGESWRALAQSQDSLIAVQANQLALSAMVNAGLRSALVRERTQTWLTRGAAVAGVVAVLVLK